jgi:hypothetical protein
LNWQRHVTYMPNASWRRWGVATARGGVSPTLGAQRKGREGCTSRARKPGETPCGREGETPLAAFAFVVAVAFQPIREGRCGEGTAPLRRVAKDCKAGRRQGGNLLPPKTALRKPEKLYAGSSTGMNSDDERPGRKAKLGSSRQAKRKEGAFIEMYTAI